MLIACYEPSTEMVLCRHYSIGFSYQHLSEEALLLLISLYRKEKQSAQKSSNLPTLLLTGRAVVHNLGMSDFRICAQNSSDLLPHQNQSKHDNNKNQ